MTNAIALTLEQERFGNGRKNKSKTSSLIFDIKKIANDSLFFFGVFLVAIVALQYIPVASGLFSEMNVGINEVAVSLLGFANVFFIQLFSKKLNKQK